MEASQNLKSWQEAFEKHSIVETRSIERQLRLSIANDKGRLRNLVGDNYRELLGTADRIVLLDKQTREVERQIYEIGQQCQPSASQAGHSEAQPRRQIIAQLRLLQRSVSEARLAFRQNEWLQCSRLVVIARLLVKSLADKSIPAVQPLQRKAASIRQALLLTVDAKLSNPLSEPQTLVETCCAYCFVTSSSSSDVLKHVQRLRLEKLRRVLGSDKSSQKTMVDTLQYILESLQVIKNLAGRSLLEALGHLQKQPIWESQPLQALELLDLKSLVALLPEEIQSFTPFFKRTPLAPRDIQQILDGWSKEARTLWLSALDQRIVNIASYTDLLQLRRNLYTALLPLYFSTTGGGELFQAIRKTVEGRMHTLATDCCLSLSHAVSRFEKFVKAPEATPSLWEPELAKLPLKDGGQKLIQQVWGRYTGRPASQTKLLRRIARWISSVKGMQDEFDKLQSIRWREHLEEPDDEQDDEAQEVLQALTQADPGSYTGYLQKASSAALDSYEERMAGFIDELGLQADQHTVEAVNLLRLVRDSLNLLRNAFRDHPCDQVRSKLPRLFGIIADGVVAKLAAWEDDASPTPPASSLDDVPSPRTFAFLQRLCSIMLEVGNTDIWSTEVVKVVQQAVIDYILQEEKRERYMEGTFDQHYIRTALGQPLATTSSQSKNAQAYWARTKLLFGVLAPQS